MNIDQLVHMANRIGSYFDAQPSRDEALLGIADHLHKFWTPSMRAQLLDTVDTGGAQDLQTIVRDALQVHRAILAPRRGGE